MKIIFLDIDGVLNPHDNMHSLSLLAKENLSTDSDIHGHLFDERCVRYLKYIIHKTEAKIVISSSWRNAGLDRVQSLWKDRNLPGEVMDITSRVSQYESFERGKQIEEWLISKKGLDSRFHWENYCILEDEPSDILDSQRKNLVDINGNFGICFDDARLAVEILNRENQ